MTRIEVRGIPAPQGSKRHVGGGRMIEVSKAVGPWRDAVRWETARAVEAPFAGPLMVRVTFYLPRPQGHYGTGRNTGMVRASAPAYPDGKPDLDKLLRSTLDGLTEGGAWKDDAQVVTVRASKRYAAGATGCVIEIGEAG
jgi:crossover junction endodeoxyribonuclease RusA